MNICLSIYVCHVSFASVKKTVSDVTILFKNVHVKGVRSMCFLSHAVTKVPFQQHVARFSPGISVSFYSNTGSIRDDSYWTSKGRTV